MIATRTRSHAAHTRAHSFYHTECAGECEQERKWAARRLITPTAFLHAARTSHGFDEMAEILDATTLDACAYLSDLDPDEWLIMVKLTGLTGTCDG